MSTTKLAKKPASKLPAALTHNASLAARAASNRHAARAHELIASIVERKREIAGAFWDIGRDLAELKDPRLYAAAGHESFEALCTRTLGLSADTAQKLVAIASRYPRTQAVTLGQERAAALLSLAEARGQLEDVAAIAGRPLALPGRHGKVRATELTANELKRAAREVRAARKHGKRAAADALQEAEALAESLSRVPGITARSALRRGEATVTVTFAPSQRADLARALQRRAVG